VGGGSRLNVELRIEGLQLWIIWGMRDEAVIGIATENGVKGVTGVGM
jgi:hypothetical protein